MRAPAAAEGGGTLAARLQQAWRTRGPLALALWPLSIAYRLLLALHSVPWRLGLRRPWRAPVPVLVVGNVVAGGAGKTPSVIALVRHLQRRGLNVGVVSRGHGRRGRAPRPVRPDSDPGDVGDEPLLIMRRCGAPVHVGADRPAAVRALLAAAPDVQIVISDDGLQHRPLAHDWSLCVFDDRGLGNGWLLPAGPLREPWPRPVDWVLNTGEQAMMPGFRARRRLADHAVRADGTTRPLGDFRDEQLLALAGIARPEGFFAMLAAAGLHPARCLALPDHYTFDSIPALLNEAFTLICTEKDAVKLWRHRPDAWAVALQLDLEPTLLAAIDTALDRRLGSAAGG